MLQAANGTVKTPFGTVAISSRQVTDAEVGDVLNYGTMKSLQKAQFEHYVKSHGFTIQQLQEQWKARAELNTYYYTWLEKTLNHHWDKLNAKKIYQTSLFRV